MDMDKAFRDYLAAKAAAALADRHFKASLLAKQALELDSLRKRERKIQGQIYARDYQPPDGEAHGLLQWKNTDVYVDLYCKCGAHMNFDGWFFYHFRCPHCDRAYAVGQNIALIEMTDEEVETMAGSCWQEVDPDFGFEDLD